MLFRLTKKQNGNFGKQDMKGFLLDLNLFWWPDKSSCEWQLDEEEDLGYLWIDQQDQADNNSYVRGYPRIVIGSAFGGWETYGVWKQLLKKLSGKRGDNNNIDRFDLVKVTELCGLPIQIKDMPDVWLFADATIPKDVKASVFFDSYLWANKGDGVNDSLTAKNMDKIVNVNIHLDRPYEDNSDAIGGGWSGGEVIAETTISGHDCYVMYKREKAVGNDFDYCSFIPKSGRVTSINATECYRWLYSVDFNGLVRKAGLEPTGRFNPSMTDAWWDSACLGSEVWSGRGLIAFRKLSVKVGDRDEVGIGASRPGVIKDDGNDASKVTAAAVAAATTAVVTATADDNNMMMDTSDDSGKSEDYRSWRRAVNEAVEDLIDVIFKRPK